MQHQISQLIATLKAANLFIETTNTTSTENSAELALSSITFDSRKVTPGTLFCCKGATFRPEYLKDAEAAGATAYLAEKIYPEIKIPGIIVSDIRKAMPIAGQFIYDNVQDKVTSLAITGTKGKSTTVFLTRAIIDEWLRATGHPGAAIISSIRTYDGVIDEESHITTPEALDLLDHFRNIEKTGITHLVLETSSQALKYDRVAGINFAASAFLNIGNDHVSPIEHTSFDDYLDSKLELFKQSETACICSSTAHYDRVYKAAKTSAKKVLTFGTNPNDDVFLSNIRSTPAGLEFHVKSELYDLDIKFPMHGAFNVENAGAAISLCQTLKVPAEFIVSGLAKAKAIGRMELFSSLNRELEIVVDYAHNQLSFEAVLSGMRKDYPDRNIVVIFGCAGGKSQARRREIPEVINKFADYAIVSEDDSYFEPFADIAADITKHLEIDHEVIQSREEALNAALGKFSAPVILLAGKGDETYAAIGGEYVPIRSDLELAAEAIERFNNQANGE